MLRRKSSALPSSAVAVVGGGWFGVHTALYLSQSGYRVTLFEQNDDIFSGISGEFGIRLQSGPHYPRCAITRKSCHRGFKEFRETYPELCNNHYRAIYALGKADSEGHPPKVGVETFRKVCEEHGLKEEISLSDFGLDPHTVHAAFDMDEPSTVLGYRIRQYFNRKLKEASVSVHCGTKVSEIKPPGKGTSMFTVRLEVHMDCQENTMKQFNHVINATGFINLTGEERMLPFDTPTVYQPVLALTFKDRHPKEQPMSLTIMDGWFPCLLPHDDRPFTETPIDKYIMLHGKYTITASYATPEEAKVALGLFTDDFIKDEVAGPTGRHMAEFWPEFADRFEYAGWTGTVLAKMRSGAEFRSSVVFQDASGRIHIFPGKINNIFDAAREAEKLMKQSSKTLTDKNGNRIVIGGTMHEGLKSLQTTQEDSRSTSMLQTFREAIDRLKSQKEKARKGIRRMSQSLKGTDQFDMLKSRKEQVQRNARRLSLSIYARDQTEINAFDSSRRKSTTARSKLEGRRFSMQPFSKIEKKFSSREPPTEL